MFVAVNRFRIAIGAEVYFEKNCAIPDTHLREVPGFIEFHLLKGSQQDAHVFDASHSIWADRAAFENWTKSEVFRAAHRNAGDNRSLYLGPPVFEGFDVVQSVG